MGECIADDLAELADARVGDRDKARLGDHDDAGSAGHAQAVAESVVGFNFVPAGAAGIDDEGKRLAVGLEPGARVTDQVIFVGDAVLVGVDLGPNLSVTGSLATVLWLIALRREGVMISGWTFLKSGILTMAPALLLATLTLLV